LTLIPHYVIIISRNGGIMPKHGKARGKSYRPDKIPETHTSFNVATILDNKFSDEHLILSVRNISDREARKIEHEHAVREYRNVSATGNHVDPPPCFSDTEGGKPAGWGLAGGGEKVEDGSNPLGTAQTELRDETGLSAVPGSTMSLFDLHKLILTDEKTGKIIYTKFFDRGMRPSVTVRSRQITVVNNIHIFRTEIKDWENSALRGSLLKRKDELLSRDQATSEDINRNGIWLLLNELAKDELDSLDIAERVGGTPNREEIDGIGLFTLRKFTSEERIRGIFPYRNHRNMARIGFIKMGLSNEKYSMDRRGRCVFSPVA
jgi:hypothetical protein